MSSKKLVDTTGLAQRLRSARIGQGLSHDRLGELLRVSGPHLAKIETRDSNPGRHLREVIEAWLASIAEPPAHPYEITTAEHTRIREELTVVLSRRDDLDAIIERLRAFPEFRSWVAALLRILESNDATLVPGIQAALNGFLRALGQEEICAPTRLRGRPMTKE